MAKSEERLGTEKIGKLLAVFSIPCIISLVLNAVYNMVDQIFIGQGVGYLGNGATNVVFPLMQIATAIALLLGEGGANYISLKLGAGEKDKAAKAMAVSIISLFAIGIIICIIYVAALKPLCNLFGATELTLPYALEYGLIISIGMIFNVFAIGSMSLVRADGKPTIAMIGMIAGFVINIAGDPIAIFVLGLGVKGAAYATILGQLANAIINIVALCRCRSVKLNKDVFRGCIKFFPTVAKGGLSSFMTQFTLVIVMAVQNNLYVRYGAESIYGAEIPMAAMGVTMKVFVVVQCAILGLATGAQPIWGYNYGQKQYKRVKDTFKIVFLISVILLAVATLWFQIAPMSIVKMFGADNALYNEFAVKCLRIFLMLVVLEVFQTIGSIFLQSLGKPIRAATLTLIRQIIIMIPALFILGALFGLDGMLYAGPVSMTLTAIVAIIFIGIEWKKLSQKDIYTVNSKEYNENDNQEQ